MFGDLSLQIVFVKQLSYRLRNFKQKNLSPPLWNFSCPICGDSSSKQTRARGYIYEKNGSLNFYCQNCTYSTTFIKFLKEYEPTLYSEFCLEVFKESHTDDFEEDETREIDSSVFITPLPLGFKKRLKLGIPCLTELPEDHLAVKYANSRKLPLNRLFYSEDFGRWAKQQVPGKYDLRLHNGDKRLVVPICNSYGKFLGAQGRTLENSRIRYETIRKRDDVKLIYGMENWNPNETGYMVEGPYDSMLLPNSLAAISSNLLSPIQHLKTHLGKNIENLVAVVDNEPRNPQIVQGLKKLIDANISVVIWKSSLKEKDINDMVLQGIDAISEVRESTCRGLEATVKFNLWKKT